jgi:hypothetical protein
MRGPVDWALTFVDVVVLGVGLEDGTFVKEEAAKATFAFLHAEH